MNSILPEIDALVCKALLLVTNNPEGDKLTEIRSKLIDLRLLCGRASDERLTWQDAKSLLPRVGFFDGMAAFKLKDGTPIFVQRGPSWVADATHSRTVGLGYDLAVGFTNENGGPVTHRMVAMFALAVDADNAKLTKKQVELLTAGFEDGSPEHKKQQELKKRFPTIADSINSFF